MTKLWKKSGKKTHPAVNDYIVSKNCEQDMVLLPYDVQASIVHAKMLCKVGLLTGKEKTMLINGLKEIEILYAKGEFKLEQSDEDCHTAIENYLTKKFGDVGKKIHTGRSRNDQVLTAMRLFSKQQLITVNKDLIKTAEKILTFAERNEFVPMPGYTHTKQAMPSSVGQWAGCFVEALLDDYGILESAYTLNDQNPLGSAAGFGTSLPIDRDFTTKELGFAKTQINTLYCQNSRGKVESFILSGLVQVMLTLGKIANDLIWFTTKEFDFFTIDESLTTGSSIMPQKKNLDILEVLRANVSIVFSYQMQIQMVGHNLISGYNKDLKITKEALIKSFKLVISSLEIMQLVFEHLKPNKNKLSSSFSTEIFATDVVNEFVLKGMPFREAYQKVGNRLKEVKTPDFVKNIKIKKHLGATGNLALNSYAEQIGKLKK